MIKINTHEQTRKIEVADASGDAVTIVVNALSAEKLKRAKEYARGTGFADNDRAEFRGHFSQQEFPTAKFELPRPELPKGVEVAEQLDDFEDWESQLAVANNIAEEDGLPKEYHSDQIDLDDEDDDPIEDAENKGYSSNLPSGQYRHRRHQEVSSTLDGDQLADLYN